MLQEDESDRKLLSAYKDLLRQEGGIGYLGGNDALDYLSNIIIDNLKLIDENHWKVQMGNTSVEVKTVLNKVAKAAQYAQSFVGSMMSGEPHAAMAWAGVSLFLPLLINASEQPKALVDGIVYIFDILCRFSVVEQLYQEQISCATGPHKANYCP
ncbi:af4c6f4e-cc03-4bff-90aa-851a24369c01 [Sclerotinia trifoliorum]|uniref:Af4c6f4e-cc03-4bff-90aa-851a24369c01 n=1 Tax=Sclerotinia trifoliorum TaxID=28548 RepID=A0A8H2VZJ0_9HELO|nr:af4c6f4e-cc03-4bff-90aa-851a24369c01 [Sclerotinia trifoliorum]